MSSAPTAIPQTTSEKRLSAPLPRAPTRGEYLTKVYKIMFAYIMIYFFFFWISSIFFPSGMLTNCEEGIKWVAHILMVALAIVFFVVDIIFANTLQTMLTGDGRTSPGVQGLPLLQINSIPKRSVFFLNELVTLVSHADLYLSCCFLGITAHTESYGYTIFGAIVMVLACSPNILAIIRFTIVYCKSKESTENILRSVILFECNLLHGIEYWWYMCVHRLCLDTSAFYAGYFKMLHINELGLTVFDFLMLLLQIMYVGTIQEHCDGGVAGVLIFSIVFGLFSIVGKCIHFFRTRIHLNHMNKSRPTQREFVSDQSPHQGGGGDVHIVKSLTLDSKDMNMDEDWIAKLTESNNRLKSNDPTLESLTFVGMPIEDKDIEMLAASMKRNTHIKTLKLRECQIGNKGALVLGDMLAENRSIERIMLEGNQISNSSKLIQGLSQNNTCQYINLMDSPVEDRMIFLINAKIAEINLCELILSDDCVQSIITCYERCSERKLTDLDLRDNPITNIGQQAIKQLIKDFPQLTVHMDPLNEVPNYV